MPGAAGLCAVGSAVKATEIALQETVQHVAGKRSCRMPLLLDTTTADFPSLFVTRCGSL